MTARRVRLGAINVTGLEHALETGHAMLLVELRALRQISNTFEIPNGEQISTAFCSTADDLRRDDFRKMIRGEKFAKVPQNPGLNSEDVANPFASQRERPIVQKDVAPDRCDIGRRVKRKYVRSTVQDTNRCDIQLDPVDGARFLANRADDLDGIIELE